MRNKLRISLFALEDGREDERMKYGCIIGQSTQKQLINIRIIVNLKYKMHML